MPGTGKRRVVRKRTYKRRTLKAKKGNVKLMSKIAQREISKAAENKNLKTSITNIGIVQSENANYDTGSIIDTSTFLRSLANGTTSGTRIGERIKLKKLMLRGTLYPNINATKPVYLKMWVVSDRFNPTNSSAGNIEDACRGGLSQPSSSWFDNGASTQGMTGNLTDMTLDVNQRRFKVYKTRLFKLAVNNLTSYHNNDFKLSYHVKINLLKYHNKIVRYFDALSNTWFTRKLFIVFQPVTLDNVADPTIVMANFSYSINAEYEDM